MIEIVLMYYLSTVKAKSQRVCNNLKKFPNFEDIQNLVEGGSQNSQYFPNSNSDHQQSQ